MIELRTGLIVFAMMAMAGCGADSPEPMAPPAPTPEHYPQPPQPAMTPAPSPSPAPRAWPLDAFIGTPADAEKAIMDAEYELAGIVGSGTPTALSVSRCARSCRALDSMRRAVERLCELTGDGGERCENARVRLETSARKVRDAGCSC